MINMTEEDYTILEQVPSVVHVNVGGQVFVTSRETLCKIPGSLLTQMFQGEVPVSKVKQNDSVYFIDRDPAHFQRILNFMRDGACVLPESTAACRELLAEATYYQLGELALVLKDRLSSFPVTAQSFNLRQLALKHHAAAGNLTACLDTFLEFTRSKLVQVTPVTDVNDDNKLAIFWLSTSMPPSNATHISFRYRGDKEPNDLGCTIKQSDADFDGWNRLWSIYHNRQLLTTFRDLALHYGLKINFHNRNEAFKQDSQLDVVWKMYRVRSLVVSISAAS